MLTNVSKAIWAVKIASGKNCAFCFHPSVLHTVPGTIQKLASCPKPEIQVLLHILLTIFQDDERIKQRLPGTYEIGNKSKAAAVGDSVPDAPLFLIRSDFCQSSTSTHNLFKGTTISPAPCNHIFQRMILWAPPYSMIAPDLSEQKNESLSLFRSFALMEDNREKTFK